MINLECFRGETDAGATSHKYLTIWPGILPDIWYYTIKSVSNMNLDSAVLYTKDVGKVVGFYRDVIGLELDYQHEDAYVQFKFGNGVNLGIKKTVESREVPGHQTILMSSDDIEKDYEKMKQLGVKFYKKISKESWGTKFSILDPDGNKVEFIQRK